MRHPIQNSTGRRSKGHIGAGMGLAGTLDNAGKVIGPILGGVLIAWLDYTPMFRVMGVMLLLSGLLVWGASFSTAARRSVVFHRH